LTLLDETQERLDREGTENVAAYTEYLLGIDSLYPMTTESLWRAVEHMQKAIELDPEYAQAHSTLGRVYLNMSVYGAIGGAEAVAKARDAASHALDIAPESSEALAILGAVELFDGNGEAAHLLLQKALEKGPNDLTALKYYGVYLGGQLRHAEAEDVFRRMLLLDPLQEMTYMWLVTNLRTQKKFPEALEIIAKWKEVLPESQAQGAESVTYIWQGKYAASLQAVLKYTLEADPADPSYDPIDPDGPEAIAWSYLLMDMPDEARIWFDRAIEINPEHPVSLAAPLWLNFHQQQSEDESVRLARKLLADRIELSPWARELALLVVLENAAKSGRYEGVLELLEKLYPNMFADPPYDIERNLRYVFYVGLALIQSGDIDRGSHLVRAFLGYIVEWVDFRGPSWKSVAGRLALGEREVAMTIFREFALVNKWWWPGIVSQTMLKHSAIFDPIRNEPEFIELLDFYERNAVEQRRLLQEMGIHSIRLLNSS